MKSHGIVKSMVYYGLVTLLMVAGTLWLLVDQAEAKGQCHKINTTLNSVADFTNFTTQGEIPSGFLKGTTMFTGDPLSLALISSTASPPIEPLTFSYTGDLAITTKNGTLTTRGVGVFEGVAFGRGTQFDTVIGGTGIFAGAQGELYFVFQSDDTGANFFASVTGVVCVI